MPALHSFPSTPRVLHVHSISCSLLIITVIFVITPTCVVLHYATLAIPSYGLITPITKNPMFFPLVVPRLRWLVVRFPPRRFDLAPRTSSVKFVFNKVALEKVTDRYFGVMPRHSSIIRTTEMGPLHAADPQRYSLTPIQGNTYRNYNPVGLGDKFNNKTTGKVRVVGRQEG